MTLKLNDTAPNFVAESTEGSINFYDWADSSWVVLFSHPKNFTPVCTTELGLLQSVKGEFTSRNTKILGLSVDAIEDHKQWNQDIKDVTGYKPDYPLIGDKDLKIAKLYGMLPANTEGNAAGRTAVDNQTVRNVFIVGPDRKIKLILVYPMATGRNFAEILRTLDSLQLTAQHKVATPANWENGDDVIIVPAVKNEQAKTLFPEGWKTIKPYLRLVKQPR